MLCNNAGVAPGAAWRRATHRDWQWVLGVNLWGVIHGVEAFVPRMIAAQEPGHIVNTASMAGLIASQGLGVYNTSKYAVVGLSETLAKDLQPYGIGVSVLCPMGVETRIRESERSRPAALENEGRARGAAVELIGRTLAPDGGGRYGARRDPRDRALRDHARGSSRAAASPLRAHGASRSCAPKA